MNKKYITIIGNGKLSKSLFLGFIASGIKNILVVNRKWKEEDVKFFKKFGDSVELSDSLENLSTENLILVVLPTGAGTVLKQILAQKPRYNNLISFISGLRQNKIMEILGTNYHSTIIATTNTNIQNRVGITCILNTANKTVFPLLEKIGKVIVENTEEEITTSIMSIGSMNAFDAQALKIIYESFKIEEGIKLHKWLGLLKISLFTSKCIYPSHSMFLKYLEEKNKALKKFNGKYESLKRHLLTAESTVNMLLSMDDDININHIDDLISTVVTKNGCTEKGINQLDNIDAFINSNKLENIFTAVHDRAIKFCEDVEKSLLI